MARTVKGLSIAEGLVALGILAMVSMFLLTLVPASGKAIAKAEEHVLADNLAQSHLERLRARGFQYLVQGTSTPEKVELQRQVFTYSTEVVYLPDSNPQLLKAVRVTVEWGDPVQRKTLESWVGNVPQ